MTAMRSRQSKVLVLLMVVPVILLNLGSGARVVSIGEAGTVDVFALTDADARLVDGGGCYCSVAGSCSFYIPEECDALCFGCPANGTPVPLGGPPTPGQCRVDIALSTHCDWYTLLCLDAEYTGVCPDVEWGCDGCLTARHSICLMSWVSHTSRVRNSLQLQRCNQRGSWVD